MVVMFNISGSNKDYKKRYKYISLLGKGGGARVDVLGSKVLLDVGVRVWRQQIRGAAASPSKAQQDQESETLAPKTEVKS